MSNVALIDKSNLPAYLQTLSMDSTAELLGGLTGIGGSAPPTIALNGTRFIVREGGNETTLNQLELQAVIIKAKPCVDKVWYATKFVPGQEAQAPDCCSSNGETPDAGCALPQATSCAGCPQNVFGSGKDASGNPTKGKACQDSKALALFANGNVYRFKVPAASLKNLAAYVKLLASNGLPAAAVVTKIGFDPAFSFPVLTFTFGGVLDGAQYQKIQTHLGAAEDVLGLTLSQVALAAPAAPVALVVAPVVAPVVAEPAPVVVEVVAEPAPVVIPPNKRRAAKPASAPVEAAPAAGPSNDALAAALGL